MKILFFSDVHWSTTSSIVRERGIKYSIRLERLIDSMSWVNQLAVDENCAMMICAGDMFDKPICTDEEITAIQEVKWNDLPCYFLCGNHESSVADLKYNSVNLLKKDNHIIITDPILLNVLPDLQINFIPYITEAERQPIENYITDDYDRNKATQLLVCHSEIQGLNYGGFTSKAGFSIEEFEDNFDLILNGHLHNGGWISDSVINLGSLTAQNFTNDSAAYKYGCWILDTNNYSIKFIENPYSLNFYKLDIFSNDFSTINKLKNNAVLSIKCAPEVSILLKEYLQKQSNVLAYRLLLAKPDGEMVSASEALDSKLLAVDHIQKFIEFCTEKLDNTEILQKELAEICK